MNGSSVSRIGTIWVWAVLLFCIGCDLSEKKATAPPPVTELQKEFFRQATHPTPTAWDPELDVAAEACDESVGEHELTGKWQLVTAEIAGKPATTDGYYEFKGNQMRMVEGTLIQERTFEMDPNSEPKRLDSRLTVPQGTMVIRAIYRIDGDTLTISDATTFRARPDQFVEKTTVENDYGICTLRRVAEPK